MADLASLENIVAPAVEALGCALWGLTLEHQGTQGKKILLRIYIEKPEGITVDDCAKVSHQINGVLAVNSPLTADYTLEVSSPGLDRFLFKPSQYVQYYGQKIKLRLRIPFEGQRNFQGVLQEADQNSIILLIESGKGENKKNSFEFDNIERANLISETGFKHKGVKR